MNASSTASFAVLIFGGFSGVYSALGLNPDADNSLAPPLFVAIVFLFTFQLAIIGSQYRQGLNRVLPKRANATPSPSPFSDLLALALFVGGFVATQVNVGISGAPFAILGIFLTADSFYRRQRVRSAILGSFVLVVMCWIYWEFIFHGFGRLVIAVIACGITAIASIYFHHVGIKLALLVGSLVALPVMAAARMEFLAESRGDTPADTEGIGSVVGPLISFARVIQASWSSLLSPHWGSTYLDAITLWIPREFWPTKPRGFGAEMVPITQPYRVSSPDYSDAALFGGELVWNFGVIGAFCVLPIVIFILTRLDQQYRGDFFADGGHSASFYRIIIVASSVSILNFVWAGSNLFAGRLQVMLVCLFFFWLAARFGENISRARDPKGSFAVNRSSSMPS